MTSERPTWTRRHADGTVHLIVETTTEAVDIFFERSRDLGPELVGNAPTLNAAMALIAEEQGHRCGPQCGRWILESPSWQE
jgi:hypothetical protein